MTFEFFRVSALKKNIIFIIIFFNQNINIAFGNILHIIAYFIDRISVNFPSEFDLCLYFIALGNSYISHVIRNTANTNMAAFHDADCGTHPRCQSLLNLLISPVSDDNFSLDSHAGNDMTILSSTMSRLVFIHEIHINCVIWYFLVKLCMQMAQWFSVFLQSKDPGFCRRKCMHPSDHTCTFIVRISLIKSLTDQLICDQCWFPHQFKRKNA